MHALVHPGCGQNVPTNSATLEVPWKKKELAPKGNQMYVTSSPSRAKRSTRSRAKLQTQASSTSSTAVQLPLGPIVADPKRKKSDLLYNEYIVYDEAQSVMRYLVRVRFEFATGRGRKRGS